MLELRRKYEQVWWRTFVAGVDAGTFKPIPQAVILEGILGMFNYSYVWLRKEGALPPAMIADLFCDTFLSGIRA